MLCLSFGRLCHSREGNTWNETCTTARQNPVQVTRLTCRLALLSSSAQQELRLELAGLLPYECGIEFCEAKLREGHSAVFLATRLANVTQGIIS